METISECKELCSNKKFLTVLDVARSRLGTQSRMAHDKLTYDRDRVNRFLGIVIRKNSKGEYDLGRVGTDVLYGQECVQNGFICSVVMIKDATAIVIAAPPTYRVSSIQSAIKINDYKKLAKDTSSAVFVMGTGMDAVKSLFFCDGKVFKRLR